MARWRKSKPEVERPHRPRAGRSSKLPELPDPRAVEGVLAKAIAERMGQTGPETPLTRAQSLIYQAVEKPDTQHRLRLAQEALQICPDCADAHVLLAEAASNRGERLAHYERGVAAGERALGPDAFQNNAGHFWGILETRPYMRARLGLANSLWTAGRWDEAVGHFQEMLRLNPNDNQGVRYILASSLLFLDRDDDVARLLDQYPDEGSATWAYTRALLAFRRQGDTPESRRLLVVARKSNKHVAVYLTGRSSPPEQPRSYSPDQTSEAMEYLGSFLGGWRSTAGAIAWVRACVESPPEVPHAKGPIGFIKKWLKDKLPQQNDVWQADCRRMPNWVGNIGTPVRTWALLVVSKSQDQVLASLVLEVQPPAALVWDLLVQAMQNPMAGEPHRPTTIEVLAGEAWAALRPHVEAIDVAWVEREGLDHLDAVFQDMTDHVCGTPAPSLLDSPGVTPDQVGRFYAAAAAFYSRAPWKRIGYESTIRVECDAFPVGPWYAILMGQSGVSTGLAVYEDLKPLQRMWSGGDRDENDREMAAVTVMFGDEWEIPTAELDAATKYGWEVARPDAYPAAIRKERDSVVRQPVAWELKLLEVCLRSVPDFVQRHKPDDPSREEFVVPVGSEELKVTLSWVVDKETAPE